MDESFEWDEDKNRLNQQKHDVSFELAQYAFFDPNRVIAQDLAHSQEENRFYCMGQVMALSDRKMNQAETQGIGTSLNLR